ncbi:hypothetical protein CIRMBP1229_02155 [Enterococcus cecorum]|nr:hypothetical protein CIRMBP1228_00839 [Enterococcus cecorum]CAI3426960.1 hypothetical protein CIRMBP1216_01829 [Enterococcus cecorum]CAI3435110.1 hypothetical protein CIRMBP1221_01846 [Enterococcus cecorum]CAI3446573.1 hypothetical protein CIRMBP1224_01934 [Enterococcus cecorum]CAI3446718.1 hypothetical protein CIRMBP1218_01915 [Enterococcus cecorum]
MKLNTATEKLVIAIRMMCEFEDETNFWMHKPLFTDEIDVSEVVDTFKEEYDSEFNFRGTASELYKAMQRWFDRNIG